MKHCLVKPYAHQRRAIGLLKSHPYYGLLMEMGTGKTLCMVYHLCHLHRKHGLRQAFVLAPAGMYHQWQAEFEKALSAEWRAEHLDLWTWTLKRKGERDRGRDLLLATDARLRVVVMNTEALSSKRGAEYARRFCRRPDTALVVDEATMIKNPKAARTKAATELGGLCDYRYILSGSLVGNTPMDVYAPVRLLHAGILGGSYYAFRARYAKLENQYLGGGRSFKKIVGYKNLAELKDRLAPHTYRVRKSECLDLPEKTYIKRTFPLSAEQRKIYDALKRDFLAVLDDGDIITTPIVLTNLQRLRQIAAGMLPVDDGPVRLTREQPRLAELLEVLDETDEKTVVWCSYRESVHQIAAALSKLHGPETVVEYIGGTRDRADLQARFNDPDNPARFFVATLQTGRYGLNLTSGTLVVYYTNDFDLDTRLQSEDRTHRIGQTRRVVYVDLVAEDTIDQPIREALVAKRGLASYLMGDNVKEWLV